MAAASKRAELQDLAVHGGGTAVDFKTTAREDWARAAAPFGQPDSAPKPTTDAVADDLGPCEALPNAAGPKSTIETTSILGRCRSASNRVAKCGAGGGRLNGVMARAWDGRALPILSARLDLVIGSKWPELGKPKERFDPDEVTARVGLAPTSTGRLGDPVAPGSRARKRHDHWYLRAGPREGDNLNETVEELRKLLDPSWAQLVTACAADDLRACISCVVELQSTFTPATRISAHTLQWMTALGANLDIDVLARALSSDGDEEPDNPDPTWQPVR